MLAAVGAGTARMPKATHLNPEYKKTAPAIEEPYVSATPTVQDLKPSRLGERGRLTADVMEERAGRIMDVIDDYLKGGDESYSTLLYKLDKATLKDIGIFMGITTDKMLTLRAQQPGQWSPQEATKADELLVALMNEVKSRGLTVTATERKIEVTAQ